MLLSAPNARQNAVTVPIVPRSGAALTMIGRLDLTTIEDDAMLEHRASMTTVRAVTTVGTTILATTASRGMNELTARATDLTTTGLEQMGIRRDLVGMVVRSVGTTIAMSARAVRSTGMNVARAASAITVHRASIEKSVSRGSTAPPARHVGLTATFRVARIARRVSIARAALTVSSAPIATSALGGSSTAVIARRDSSGPIGRSAGSTTTAHAVKPVAHTGTPSQDAIPSAGSRPRMTSCSSGSKPKPSRRKTLRA